MPKSWKTIEIEQQCRYGFTEEYVTKLCNEWSVIKDYAWVNHNRGIHKDGSSIDPHIHLMIRFNDSVPTAAILAKLIGVCGEAQLRKMINWKAAITYLTHKTPEAMEGGKEPYNDEEVHSNFDWQKDREDYQKGSKRLDYILQQIDAEIIRPYNVAEYMNNKEYDKFKRSILNAFEYQHKKARQRTERNMECVFISGSSGSGKTTYAKDLCASKGMSVYISSGGKNPLDDYGGEDAVILDDLRPSDYKYSELLKLLDNNTSSMVGCRYYNKSIHWCKMIIITSIMPIEEWYMGLQNERNEPLKQLKRRCKTYVEMTDNKMYVRAYDPAKGDYGKTYEMANMVAKKYLKGKTEEDILDDISVVLGVAKEMLKDTKGFKEVPDYLQGEIPFE